jgi:hypothetical protein
MVISWQQEKYKDKFKEAHGTNLGFEFLQSFVVLLYRMAFGERIY